MPLESLDNGVSLALPWFMQTKLRVGAVDDPLEREADRIAERVVSMPSNDTHEVQAKSRPDYTFKPTEARIERMIQCAQALDSPNDAGLTCVSFVEETETEPGPDSMQGGVIQRQSTQVPSTTSNKLVARTLTWADFNPVASSLVDNLAAYTQLHTRASSKGTNFTAWQTSQGSWYVQGRQTPDILRHEQYHLKLAVLIANKANAAIGTMAPAALISAFSTAEHQYTRVYDDDTVNGTKADLQKMWENDIDGEGVAFPGTF